MASVALQITPSAPPLLTLEQWAAQGDEERGELVDGVLEEEEMPNYLHETIQCWFLLVLGTWADARGGWVFGSEAKFAVAPQRGRKPDLTVFFATDRLPNAQSSLARQPPDIAVEILSPQPRDRRRDRVEKFLEYARFGVRYYWIVDPQARTLEVFERAADGRYVLALAAAEGQHATPGCEGLTLDLDALWAKADRLPKGEDDESE